MTQTEFIADAGQLRYPEVPGHQNRDTSRAAAAGTQSIAGTIRGKCLECFATMELTADEIAETLRLSVLTVRPRITELARMGRIVDSGDRRPNESGKRAIVWRLA